MDHEQDRSEEYPSLVIYNLDSAPRILPQLDGPSPVTDNLLVTTSSDHFSILIFDLSLCSI